ncbi:MAG TPA: BrnT family toxin [Plasticicumulans sp.]|uniref:BrnT family toxin n=1 Tax=Plasticicumulans sp. TaxID=2307179 RepID=UPI002CF4E484|nr:BrnT family toxin [Plasticicumulans sp.]MBS0600475.1 BrnT family toxin [Pseudomonadota bacterium]HMV39510.1 BrnT family toxin [Plasticicumulans sp.]HNB89801.1 BrnT family toxin [Plasticicumulans sp.]HNE00230.1 BrnT family toxin [Plasticicumulans sp.]HNF64601.1 BrnT family toxin [Plasticicumulans sp.]
MSDRYQEHGFDDHVEWAWDEQKNASNIEKHGIDFQDLPRVTANPILIARDTRRDYGEIRWQAIGRIQGITIAFVFTEREPRIVRIISARKASKNERIAYETAIRDRLGPSAGDDGR